MSLVDSSPVDRVAFGRLEDVTVGTLNHKDHGANCLRLPSEAAQVLYMLQGTRTEKWK